MTFARCSLSALTLFVALLACQLPAADKDDEGWIKLFNGTDLTGWKASEEGDWKVVDGAIVTPPKRTHLFTEQEFVNFHLKVELMTLPMSNAGIYFHTKYEENWPTVGYETQVNNTHADPVKTGSLYNVVKLYESPVKDNEWWLQEVIVKGKNIQIKLNGKLVIDYTEPEGVTATRRLGKGSIALQAHDPISVVKFRSVTIKPLP